MAMDSRRFVHIIDVDCDGWNEIQANLKEGTMMSRQEEGLRLQVAGANDKDVGKGTARLNKKAFEELGIDQGEVIEIVGEERTAAIALPPFPEDEGLPIIRLDGLLRGNANVSMGDWVTIRPGKPKPAKKVVLAPAQKNMRLRGSGQALMRTLLKRPLVTGDVISTSVYRRSKDMDKSLYPEEVFRAFFEQKAFGLQEIRLVVTKTSPADIVQITPETEIELLSTYVEPEQPRSSSSVTYDDIGGLGDTIKQVREMIELPLKHPILFQRLGIDPPKGVLLHGPPGTGKTLLARAVANESEAEFFHVAGPEIMGRHYGESEQKLREVFEKAQNNSPAIIFFDEIDSIAPKREQATGEVEQRVVAQLLTLLDGLEPRQNVVVIGATNRVDGLDEALRRPGRFDREIVIGVPDGDGRRQILEIHTRGMPLGEDVDLAAMARQTYGFVGADLAALCREAAIEALRRNLPKLNLDDQEEIPQEALDSLEVNRADFSNAQKRVQPSAMREIMVQVPDVTWEDVGGADSARQALQEGIEMPLNDPEAFYRLGIRPARGFLLYGPPGTGKTLLAKAVAREAQANFVATKSSDLLSKWYGESEQQISKLFERARQVAPTVIFIDEIDSLAPQRGGGLGDSTVTERVVNTLLAEMDGLESRDGVAVIGATNRPTLLDSALLRPGRFDELVYMPVPDEAGRRQILGIHTREMPVSPEVNMDRIAARTAGFTGADLENLVRRAGLFALREDMESQEVSREHFEKALQQSNPSVTEAMEREYEEMQKQLKQENPRGPRRMGFQLDQD